jgi:hypothetical protein
MQKKKAIIAKSIIFLFLLNSFSVFGQMPAFCWKVFNSKNYSEMPEDHFTFVAEGKNGNVWAFTDQLAYRWNPLMNNFRAIITDSVNNLNYMKMMYPSEIGEEIPPAFTSQVTCAGMLNENEMLLFDDFGHAVTFNYQNKTWSSKIALDFVPKARDVYPAIPFTPAYFRFEDIKTTEIDVPDLRIPNKYEKETIVDIGQMKIDWPDFSMSWIMERMDARVNDMAISISGRMYFATDNGIFYFKQGMTSVKRIIAPMDNVTYRGSRLRYDAKATSVILSKGDNIDLHFAYGSFLLTINNENTVSDIDLENVANWGWQRIPGKGDEEIMDMVADNSGRIYAATKGSGLLRFSRLNMAKIEYITDVEKKPIKIERFCVGVGLYGEYVWIATTTQVFRCDSDLRNTIYWDHTNTDVIGKKPEQTIFDANYIKGLHVMSNGDVWLTTFGRGLLFGKRVD